MLKSKLETNKVNTLQQPQSNYGIKPPDTSMVNKNEPPTKVSISEKQPVNTINSDSHISRAEEKNSNKMLKNKQHIEKHPFSTNPIEIKSKNTKEMGGVKKLHVRNNTDTAVYRINTKSEGRGNKTNLQSVKSNSKDQRQRSKTDPKIPTQSHSNNEKKPYPIVNSSSKVGVLSNISSKPNSLISGKKQPKETSEIKQKTNKPTPRHSGSTPKTVVRIGTNVRPQESSKLANKSVEKSNKTTLPKDLQVLSPSTVTANVDQQSLPQVKHSQGVSNSHFSNITVVHKTRNRGNSEVPERQRTKSHNTSKQLILKSELVKGSRIPVRKPEKPNLRGTLRKLQKHTHQMIELHKHSKTIDAHEKNMHDINSTSISDNLDRLAKLKSQNHELHERISFLEGRLLKEEERNKGVPKVTSIVPTSLENLENERKKYAALELENERLIVAMKELTMTEFKKRKAKDLEVTAQHANEIAFWKIKVRDLELDNHQLVELISKREVTIEKLVKEKQYLHEEMMMMRRLQMHLSNKLDQEFYKEKDSTTDPVAPTDNSIRKTGTKFTPHYAGKLIRDNEIGLREGNITKLSQQFDIIENENGQKVLGKLKDHSHHISTPHSKLEIKHVITEKARTAEEFKTVESFETATTESPIQSVDPPPVIEPENIKVDDTPSALDKKIQNDTKLDEDDQKDSRLDENKIHDTVVDEENRKVTVPVEKYNQDSKSDGNEKIDSVSDKKSKKTAGFFSSKSKQAQKHDTYNEDTNEITSEHYHTTPSNQTDGTLLTEETHNIHHEVKLEGTKVELNAPAEVKTLDEEVKSDESKKQLKTNWLNSDRQRMDKNSKNKKKDVKLTESATKSILQTTEEDSVQLEKNKDDDLLINHSPETPAEESEPKPIARTEAAEMSNDQAKSNVNESSKENDSILLSTTEEQIPSTQYKESTKNASGLYKYERLREENRLPSISRVRAKSTNAAMEINSDALRSAKIQLEYSAYVDKEKAVNRNN
ncbi:hypothetical protein HK103_005538 [Boothiomyces macroporosus]|uniref:Lebercilin domain-containing protein n=1 Tax=Boothiomyces macroporosus TaxID=261099 RepID=A0AAD5Y2Q1_9FUNG|nr:hypothetical protein HK103_005538 [Boothiomyces macroporosus]